MEIQSFILCRQITQVKNEFNALGIGLFSFFSLDGLFPLEFKMPFHILVRRDDRSTEQFTTLRFNLIDSDGLPAGEPDGETCERTFKVGEMFMHMEGEIGFSFPKPGDYRLDITINEAVNPATYQYNIEITR
jgi:hypothetical protein